MFVVNSLLGSLLLCSVFCLSVSLRAFPACCDPVVSLFVYCLLEEACRYRRYFEAIQGVTRKSDAGEDCRWTVALRHSSKVRSTALVLEGIGITSSFPTAFFICNVGKCSELAVLGFGVVLVRQHNVILDGNLYETPLVCSGETTCPMGWQ